MKSTFSINVSPIKHLTKNYTTGMYKIVHLLNLVENTFQFRPNNNVRGSKSKTTK